jgi:hypothetical protein
LSIESSLHFCSNYGCTKNDANGNPTDEDHLESSTSNDAGWIVPANGGEAVKNVERRQIFWVAHRIDTWEFQHYYLEPRSVKIGPFVPKIHKWDQVKSTVTVNPG